MTCLCLLPCLLPSPLRLAAVGYTLTVQPRPGFDNYNAPEYLENLKWVAAALRCMWFAAALCLPSTNQLFTPPSTP